MSTATSHSAMTQPFPVDNSSVPSLDQQTEQEESRSVHSSKTNIQSSDQQTEHEESHSVHSSKTNIQSSDQQTKQGEANSVPSAKTQPVLVSKPSTASLYQQTELVRQKFLECYVCNKNFDEEEHIPRILPCLHCICQECLKSINSKDVVVCPECRVSHSVANGNIDVFQRDGCREYLIRYLNVQTNETGILCDECNGKSRGTHRCKECSQFLCNDCTDAHMRTKLTKKHEITSLNKLKDCTAEEFQTVQQCQIEGHEGLPFSYYCQSTSCDKPVCAVCAVQFHPENHKIRKLTEVYSETKKTVDFLMSKLKHKQLSLDDTVTLVDDTLENLDSVKTKLTAEIDIAVNKCQRKLEEKREELKNELLNVIEVKKKRLHEQLNALNTLKKNVEDAHEFVNCTTTYASPTELMNLKDQIIERLKELNSEQLDTTPKDNADIKFQNENMDGNFKTFLENMGKIRTPYMKDSMLVNNKPGSTGTGKTPITIYVQNEDKAPTGKGGVGIRVEIKDKDDVTFVGQITPRDVKHDDVCCADLSFDADVAHTSIYIFPDGKMMKTRSMRNRASNLSSRESGPRVMRFRHYKGTIGNKCFCASAGLVYWEIVVQYRILYFIRQNMLFEMGLARFDCIDKHYTVDRYPYGWALSARGCDKCSKICLQTWHNGELMTHTPISSRTVSPPNTVNRQHYGFLLDSYNNRWIIVDLKSRRVLFQFMNLVLSEDSDPLYPVFAMYNPDQVQVTMEILSGQNIAGVPKEALKALYEFQD